MDDAEGAFRVELDDGDGRVLVGVHDEGTSRPYVAQPNPDEVDGRGLLLVEAVAVAWGVDHDEDRMGKLVWFELAL